MQIETKGKPGVLVVTNNFFSDAESAAMDVGMPTIRIVRVPAEFYYKARVSVEEMRPVAANAIGAITAALTKPLTAAEAKPKPMDKASVKQTIKVTGKSYSEAAEKVNAQFLSNRWSDGLPIVPPTREAVKLMLTGTSRAPTEVLGKVAIKNGIATIEKIAINSVMAGAKPEYLPVIIAAMEAMLDKDFDLKHLLASTGSCTPVIQVNGPIAKEIDINSGIGYMGHGWRANSTIGRAVRMCTINLGHVWPQANDMGLTGREAAYTNYTFAENEEDSPWKPYHVDLGFKPEESTVTVSSMMWYLRQGPGGAVTTHTPEEQLQILNKILVDMGYPTTPARAWLWSKRYIVGMDPGLARELAKRGYTKDKVKQYFFENARVPYSALFKNDIRGLREAVEDGRISNVVSLDMLREGGLIPVVKGPDFIHLVVVGGMPGYTGVWSYPGPNFGHVTKKIKGATLTKAGK
jgi:hypothetical protein